jgi:coronin-7
LALPSFQHNHPQLGLAFLRKDKVDIREVEVACSIRLSKEEMQRVGWKITRSRPEFFQDDVYPPSVIVEASLLNSSEWLMGKDATFIPRKSLQPEGMTACEWS